MKTGDLWIPHEPPISIYVQPFNPFYIWVDRPQVGLRAVEEPAMNYSMRESSEARFNVVT